MPKVWKVPSKVGENVSLPIPSKPYIPSNNLYTLYRKVDGKYNRVAMKAYPDRIAARVFGGMVGRNPLEYSIRLAKIECLEAK